MGRNDFKIVPGYDASSLINRKVAMRIGESASGGHGGAERHGLMRSHQAVAWEQPQVPQGEPGKRVDSLPHPI